MDWSQGNIFSDDLKLFRAYSIRYLLIILKQFKKLYNVQDIKSKAPSRTQWNLTVCEISNFNCILCARSLVSIELKKKKIPDSHIIQNTPTSLDGYRSVLSTSCVPNTIQKEFYPLKINCCCHFRFRFRVVSNETFSYFLHGKHFSCKDKIFTHINLHLRISWLTAFFWIQNFVSLNHPSLVLIIFFL